MATVVRTFEMSLTREEFLRHLPAAVGNVPFTDDGQAFRHEEVGRNWRITIRPLPPVTLGAMSLERHRVAIQFTDCPQSEIAAFLDRFAMHFQRGGG